MLIIGEASQAILVTSGIFALYVVGAAFLGLMIFRKPETIHKIVTQINKIAHSLKLARKKPLIDEESILVWGGINRENKRLGDGWLLTFNPE